MGYTMQAQSEDPAIYKVTHTAYERSGLVQRALDAMRAESVSNRELFDSPRAVRDFLTLWNGRHADQFIERFSAMFLDSQNRLIEIEELFKGTLTQTSVYPREVVRAALRHNAAGVILTHNHPSCNTRPSRADESITQALKSALALVDVRVLDHIITSGDQSASMAELGLV